MSPTICPNTTQTPIPVVYTGFGKNIKQNKNKEIQKQNKLFVQNSQCDWLFMQNKASFVNNRIVKWRIKSLQIQSCKIVLHTRAYPTLATASLDYARI